MIQGVRVTLRPARPADYRAVYEWMARSTVTPSMMGPPNYSEAPIPTWDEFCSDYLPLFFDGTQPLVGQSFIIESAGEAIGHISYSQVVLDERRAELDIWLRSEAHCGRGHGSEALVLLMDYLREALGLVEFIIRPSARNERALRAYSRAGFVPLDLSPPEQIARFGPTEYTDTVTMHRKFPADPGSAQKVGQNG